jgi:serine/threonine protein kinase/peptidoglycan hydrolase-like protein with peptidoglycan-binding domain
MVEMRSETTTADPDVDFVALPVGTLIGRYEVLSVLGQGGFGITYRARDIQLDREVAIKEYLPTALAVRQNGVTVMPRSTKAAEDFTWGRDRFVAEGRVIATLHRAPGIVRVYDFLEINGTAYIVMEMLHGDTLEGHIRKNGRLDAPAIDRILWPLLDGLEQVHTAGFLHRDIKPANILLDAEGNPTLIDFGASRAAMAGRTVAMTAIFTPGYAAPEQFTSARQGPWTDIYGVSATLYHAITGRSPPSAFDRMLDDAYEPVASAAPPGFSPGLLAGIDAGLMVRATDRPQSIAGWRQILALTAAPDDALTVAARSRPDAAATIVANVAEPVAAPPPSPGGVETVASQPKSRVALYAGTAVAALLLAGGGYLMLAPRPATQDAPAPRSVAVQEMKVEDLERALAERRAADAAAADRKRAEEAARNKAPDDGTAKQAADPELEKAQQLRQKAEEDLAKLKAEIEARRQEEQTLALRQAAADAQQKADAEAAAASDRKAAEAAELALRLSPSDRQRIQVALTSLGFDTRGYDGALGPRSREMIAGWQKARDLPATGFLTGPQQQALLREAAPAVARYDDAQKKADEDARAKAAAAAAPAAAPPSTAAPTAAASAPVAPAAAPAGTVRWAAKVMCDFWPGPLPISVPVTDGRGSGSVTGRFTGTTVTIDISGNSYSGSINARLRNGNPKVLVGSFSGVLSGSQVRGQTTIRAEMASPMGPNTSACTIELDRAG